MRRLEWLKTEIVGLTELHGREATPPLHCKCGFESDDPTVFYTHMADVIVALIADRFQIIEFDQSWQTVFGCDQEQCRWEGINRDMHQHKIEGVRLELREKRARVLEEGAPNGGKGK